MHRGATSVAGSLQDIIQATQAWPLGATPECIWFRETHQQLTPRCANHSQKGHIWPWQHFSWLISCGCCTVFQKASGTKKKFRSFKGNRVGEQATSGILPALQGSESDAVPIPTAGYGKKHYPSLCAPSCSQPARCQAKANLPPKTTLLCKTTEPLLADSPTANQLQAGHFCKWQAKSSHLFF